MRNIYSLLIAALFLSGCNMEEAQSITDNVSTEKVWVFAQYNVLEKDEKIEDYYYYGKISKPLYERIKSNRISHGFILMEDVKYWGGDDLIHNYSDGENSGEIVFRIESLAKMELVKKKPIAGKGSEQFKVSKAEKKPLDQP
jgi:hypothetical protein